MDIYIYLYVDPQPSGTESRRLGNRREGILMLSHHRNVTPAKEIPPLLLRPDSIMRCKKLIFA